MRELLAELTEPWTAGRACVYCSVVETRGSTPQKAGAAMLVFPDGSQGGTLGGGCVEAEVKRQALRTPRRRRRRRAAAAHLLPGRQLRLGRRPDLRRPHEHPGRPARRRERVASRGLLPPFRALVEAGRAAPRRSSIAPDSRTCRSAAAICSTPPAGCSTSSARRPPPKSLPAGLVAAAAPAAAVRSQHGVAYLPVLPRITLLIVGGGHVGQAVARLAAEVDFDVWVLDDRDRLRQPRTLSRRPSASSSATSAQQLQQLAGRDHAVGLCPDRDARPRPRRGGALSPGRPRRRLRRHDRQQTQDQAHLSRTCWPAAFPRRRSNASTPRSASPSARRRCRRSPSASSPS